MVCAGQFIDHDVVATVDGDGDDTFDISLQNGAQTATMSLHRLVTVPGPGSCPVPHNVISPLIDAGPVYGDETEFTQMTLRAPGAPSPPHVHRLCLCSISHHALVHSRNHMVSAETYVCATVDACMSQSSVENTGV